MSLGTIEKDPQAELDYAINWKKWLATGETIAESTWDIDDGTGELTKLSDGLNAENDRAVIWVSGGMKNKRHNLINTITTSENRKDQRTITLKILDR